MVAAQVDGAASDSQAATCQAPMPVRNTFIHFGAMQQRRALRQCVTDPDDPKLWQARTPAWLQADPISDDKLGRVSPVGRPATIGEEGTKDEESPLQPGFDTAMTEELQIDIPRAYPRHISLSPWSASASLSLPSLQSPPAASQESTFRFTLRLADDTGLGIDLAADCSGVSLCVQSVLPSGAIDAWNRRCLDGSATAGKDVHPGDLLVCVNGKTDKAGMLAECRSKLLLAMTFVRKTPSEEFTAGGDPGAVAEQQDTIRPLGHRPKVVLQINEALEGERLHANRGMMQARGPMQARV